MSQNCIGNIIIDDKIKVSKYFNVITLGEEACLDVPTLIVGLDYVKEFANLDDLNFIDRKISDDEFWTFSRKEKRVLFEEDLFYFIEHCYNHLVENVNYEFIDVILRSDEDLKKTFKNISQIENLISLRYLNMVYIYGGNTIFGLDLRQVKYTDGNIDKLIEKIKGWSEVFLDDEQILIEYKNDLSRLNDEIKYIPILYSIRKNE